MKFRSVLLFFLLLISTGLFSQISTDGLLAYYPLDGTVLDFGPSAYNTTLFDGEYIADQDGNPNSALLLNGSDQFMYLSGFGSTFRENLDQMTIYFKIKFEGQNDQQTILSLGSPGENLETNVFEIEYENNQLQVETETGSSAINHELQIDEPLVLFDNEWHEIMITIDGDSLTYCKDGQIIYKDTYIPSESLSNNLYIGCYGGVSSSPCCFLNGAIDELQFYNRILDKNELSVSIFDNLASFSQIKCYPNPTTNKVNVAFDKPYKSLQIILSDLNGKSILTKSIKSVSEFSLDMPDADGVYFLNIQSSDSEFATFKIIKR